MSTILSDITVAQQRATALSGAVEGLAQGGEANRDERSTVQGNGKAASAIAAGDAAMASVRDAFTSASRNIQSVAEGFEVLDNQVASNPFSNPKPGG